MTTGYLHANYANSFAALGTPYYLPEAQGWLLKRPIPFSPHSDAMGCYPVFSCKNWRQLGAELETLQPELVSLMLVTDPLGEFVPSELQATFPDLWRPYKDHFIVDLQPPLGRNLPAHHRRNVRQALSQVVVEPCTPTAVFEEWVTLYAHLTQRHQITGLAAFSRASFAAQWQVPGLTVLRATAHGETVGMTLWYREEERIYYHLAAYSPRGYELKASYALFQAALEHFAHAGARWMALGAGAGTHNDGSDGLTRFKRGWATETRPAYLGGRIFNHQAYANLAGPHAVAANSFFPAYRHPSLTASLNRSHTA